LGTPSDRRFSLVFRFRYSILGCGFSPSVSRSIFLLSFAASRRNAGKSRRRGVRLARVGQGDGGLLNGLCCFAINSVGINITPVPTRHRQAEMLYPFKWYGISITWVLILWALAGNATAGEITGTVIGVSDGDTLTVLTSRLKEIKVRLAEIDAPEKRQAYGERSKQSLSALAYRKRVRIDDLGQDRYGRTLGRVWVSGRDVNAEQVRRGMAWVYRKYADSPTLLALENEARRNRRGLWANARPVPPWKFRKKKKPSTAARSKRSWSCGSKKYCKDMSSCAEARFYLWHCGLKRLDGDKDGTPCESLCR